MIGIDIVKISRIKEMIVKYEQKFIKRFFHELEILHSKNYSNNFEMFFRYFAKRFAAKEAYIKALGSGKGIKMADIAVLNDKNGKPVLHFNNKKIESSSVSLSDDGNYAIAAVALLS